MSLPLTARRARHLAAAVRSGKLLPTQLVEAAAEAVRAAESGPLPLGVFLSLDLDGARERARALEDDLRAGAALPPLAGVPVAVKDNLCTARLPTTCGSRLLEGYLSPYEATVVRRLREAGALLLGKTNLDELAMGSSTAHSAFGPTRNPRDRTRSPGGSSGGSAAAVAAGIVPFALGSDSGGSVRQPAALCGVVGIRPTYGRVSRYGLVAFASSLDQVGTLGRTVDDAAWLLEVVSGHDPLDSTSADLPAPDLCGVVGEGIEGVVIGVPREYFPDSLHPGVRDLCRAALRRLEALGAQVREVSLGHTAHALPAYTALAAAEASSNLARFDGARFGVRAPDARTPEEVYERTRALFGPEVKRRILLGTHLLSGGAGAELHERAGRVRARVARDFEWVFRSGVDAVFTLTTPTPAFRLEEAADPSVAYRADAFTAPASLAGLPALSLPIGEVGGLPVGGQIVADRWREETVVRIAAALERSR